MAGLLDLAAELLCLILRHVRPNDIDNFLLSCKRVHGIASKDFLDNHTALKHKLRRVDNWSGVACQTAELLELILDEPCKADYVTAMVVRPWKTQWDWGPQPRARLPGQTPSLWYPFCSDRLRVFKQGIEDTKSIASEKKDDWIRNMSAGDENPVIALIILQLNHLTSLVIALSDREDSFILQTLQRIAKDPHSSSLSRLRRVEICRISPKLSNSHSYDVQYLLACAALPSIVSLEGSFLDDHYEEFYGNLDEEFHGELFGPESEDTIKSEFKEDAIDLVPQTSSLQHLKLDGCVFRRHTLRKLIRSARSLRSLKYTYFKRHRQANPSHAVVCEVLLESASTTLMELALNYSPFSGFYFGKELDFSTYRNLRTLTIEYPSLMGWNFRATDKMATLLPASLETLVIRHCLIESPEWLRQVVGQLAKAKARLLPRLTELTLTDTIVKAPRIRNVSILRGIYAIGAEAGIWTTVRFYRS